MFYMKNKPDERQVPVKISNVFNGRGNVGLNSLYHIFYKEFIYLNVNYTVWQLL